MACAPLAVRHTRVFALSVGFLHSGVDKNALLRRDLWRLVLRVLDDWISLSEIRRDDLSTTNILY